MIVRKRPSLQSILELKLFRQMTKPFATRPVSMGTKNTPGFCVMCGSIATVHALFKVPDATVMQRYCDTCLPKADYVWHT